MAPSDQNMTRRVDGLEVKLDAVSEKIDNLSVSVDRRFEQVDGAFVEQRQYTEFAFQRLEGTMDAKFSQLGATMDARFGRLDGHIGRVERKVDELIDIIKS
jgi:hypothetical protein